MWDAQDGQAGVRPEDEIDLAALDEVFAAAQIPEGFAQVPDGEYEVRVERVEIVKARTTGNPALKWTLEVLGPEYSGRKLWRYNVMNTPENVGWLKKNLQTCGFTVTRASDLRPILQDLLDVRLRIRVKSKGESQNIYFVKRLDDAGVGGGAVGEGAVPF